MKFKSCNYSSLFAQHANLYFHWELRYVGPAWKVISEWMHCMSSVRTPWSGMIPVLCLVSLCSSRLWNDTSCDWIPSAKFRKLLCNVFIRINQEKYFKLKIRYGIFLLCWFGTSKSEHLFWILEDNDCKAYDNVDYFIANCLLLRVHPLLVQIMCIRVHSHCAFFFSDCDCDSYYHSKWVVQNSMEVFTLCNCDNLTSSYAAHCKQNHIAVANRTVWTERNVV